MVYASLDWFTAMLRNMSLRDVLEKLEIFDACYDDLLDEAFHKVRGFYSDYVFRFNGIGIEVNWSDYMSVNEEFDKIIDFKFSKIRLDISGSGLRYIRSLFDDSTKLDRMLSDVNLFGDNLITITRCDFAYDFVNLHPTFIDDFCNEISSLMFDPNAPRSRHGGTASLSVDGGVSGQSFKYQIKYGNDIKCLYFGTTRSDRLIRMYDKKLQLTDKNGAWKKQLDGLIPSFPSDENIDSWFRIEIQCRKKWAYEYLFNMNGDMLRILRHLFDTCKFKDPRNGQVFESVRKLFSWDELPTFVCILHFTELRLPVLQQAEKAVDKALSSLLLLYDYYGMDIIYSLMQSRLNNMNRPSHPRHVCQNVTFKQKRVQLHREHPNKKNYHIYEDDGNNLYLPDYRRS